MWSPSRFAIGVWFLAIVGSPAILRAQQPAPPSLGAAASFAVLGGSSVTSSGSTIVTGNLGVSPGNTVTGFLPGAVKVGATFRNDSTARQAQRDAAAAYNDLAGKGCGSDLSGQDLGGKTLRSGVYCFSSSAQLTGMLILDAANDPNAVWIFRIGSTLTTTANSSVLMTNGGWGGNVFWQVGSSASLRASTTFVGNLLALTDITLGNGVTVSGRLISRGVVGLDTNNVSLCCATIILSPQTLPSGLFGATYNQPITASGGVAPYTFSVSGTLPTGLAFTPASPTGTISGTPTAIGVFTFCITVTDSNLCAVTQCYTMILSVGGPALSEWGMVVLSVLLVGTGWLMMRRAD